MDLQLKNKVIIVTGGASGIGESIVKRLAEEGAIPCIIDYNQDALSKLSNEFSSRNKEVFIVHADLTDAEACKNGVNKIIGRFQKIDGLVNNAGLNDGVGLEHGTSKEFLNSLNRNVTHYYAMAHYAVAYLKVSKGAIVNICSKVAETGQGGTSGYAAANGVRLELTREWARELLPYNVRVNAVVVAECFTPQYEWWINQQSDPIGTLNSISQKVPLGKRLTTSIEIADTTIFLLSPKSGTITGEFFHVDGGYVHLDRKQ